MSTILQDRKGQILRILIEEYISRPVAVSSEAISRSSSLGLSPATIRNELAKLEETGYLTRPHTSSGSIPTDKGYRYYVETLLEIKELPQEQQARIRKVFHNEEREFDEWFRLAAAILAGLSQYFALVTEPKAPKSRLKHVELVLLRDYKALLIVVFDQARLRQQIVTFNSLVSQEELSLTAQKFTFILEGHTAPQIIKKKFELKPVEEQILNIILSLMDSGADIEFTETYIDGIRYILIYPELASNERTKKLMEMVEKKELEKLILPRIYTKRGIQVVIGDENPEEALKHCSIVISRYGIPGEIGGIIGLLGPTRMNYGWAISATRFLCSILSEFTNEIYGNPAQSRSKFKNYN